MYSLNARDHLNCSNVQPKCQGSPQLLSLPLLISTTKQMWPNGKGEGFSEEELCGLPVLDYLQARCHLVTQPPASRHWSDARRLREWMQLTTLTTYWAVVDTAADEFLSAVQTDICTYTDTLQVIIKHTFYYPRR